MQINIYHSALIHIKVTDFSILLIYKCKQNQIANFVYYGKTRLHVQGNRK